MNVNLLKARLADFGLNPREWHMEIKNMRGGLFQIRLRHRRDQELVLSGWADRRCWIDLCYQG